MAYDIPVPQDAISVTLAVGLAAYQKTLASSLLRAGMLRRVFSSGPPLEILEPDSDGSLRRIKRFPVYSFSIRAMWAIWHRLPDLLRPRPPVMLSVSHSDQLMAKWMTSSTIFHGRTAGCLAGLGVAKHQGAITLVENASRHPRHWQETEIEECRRFGISIRNGSGDLDEPMMRRREQEFQRCDRIVVPSTVARQSFAEMGYGDKTEVVFLGVNADLFSPTLGSPRLESPTPGTPTPDSAPPVFRVCCVGRVELAKGLAYLLEAWKRLALPRAELLLVGEVKVQMKSLLKTIGDSSVRLTGFLPAQEVAQCYRESNLSVFPSPNEGFGLVLLEAMASGLPTIGTDMTGAVDCIENGKEGFIVPARDVDALADAILWCYKHPDESKAMGRAARARIEREFTLEHYNQRVMTLYRSLAGKQEQPTAGTPSLSAGEAGK